jgi:carotenoid cleavage dioxygenase-like enzyme
LGKERHSFPLATSYEWKPETGTQVLILEKNNLSKRRIVDLPPFGFFHLGDAWEEADGTIRFDVCAYPNMRFAASGRATSWTASMMAAAFQRWR